MDDNPLSVTLCEEASDYDNDGDDALVPVHPACCAGEAEYSLIFEVIFPVTRELYHNIHPSRDSGVRRHIQQISLSRSGCLASQIFWELLTPPHTGMAMAAISHSSHYLLQPVASRRICEHRTHTPCQGG